MLFTGEKISKRDQDVSYYYHSLSRVVLAALMGVGVVAHVYLNTPSPKWLIYMTDQVLITSNTLLDKTLFQGITLLAIHYVLHAFLVLWAKCR